jgi:hypothetical protein
MTPAAASNVCPSGLGWEGVTILNELQTDASIRIIQSNGHYFNAHRERCDRAAGAARAAGDRFIDSAHKVGIRALR